LISDVLMECMQAKELVEVYTDRKDAGKFHVGFVTACSRDHCVMMLVSPEGYSDGYLLVHVEDIFRTQAGGAYERKMQTLMKYRNTKPVFIEMDSSNLVFSFLDYAKSTGSIVSLEVFDYGFGGQGFVENVDADECKLRYVNSFGENDGEGYVRLEDIAQVSMNGQEENILEILHTEYYR
jgi:hypothetical protein